MATTLFKVSRASSDVAPLFVAPAPSGGTYIAASQGSSGSGNIAYFARINSDGTVNWQKEISLAGDPSVYPRVASSTSHVALVLTYLDPDTFYNSTAVQLYDSSGTLVWHKAYQFQLTNTDAFLIDPTGTDVYLVGQLEYYETILLKLDGATGDEEWSVNIRCATESDSVDGSGPIVMLSGGDVVLYTRGPPHTSGTSSAYVQRCASADGAVVWSRSVAWPLSGLSYTGIAVDASDNIYLWGREFFDPTYAQLPVVKLDSSGATLWNRQLQSTVALQSRSLNFTWSGRGVGGTDGVLIPTNYGVDAVDSYPRRGFVNVSAAGTTGTAVANLVTFDDDIGSSSQPYSYPWTGQQILFAYEDATGSDETAVVALGGYNSSEDSAFGPYTRTTFAYDLEAGSATIASATFTRAAPVAVSAGTARTITSASGSLVITTYTPSAPTLTGTATGIASTLAFGPSPYVFGLVTGIASTTAFGSPTNRRAQPATGLASTLAFGTPTYLIKVNATGSSFPTSFGTPTYNLNLAYGASSIAPTTAIGEIWAWPGTAPQPKSASSVASALAFGLPAATSVTQATAGGFQSTVFGDARIGYGLGATALDAAPTFGSATVRSVRGATGFSSTVFGLAQIGVSGYPQGFAVNLRFGLPVANFANLLTTTGTSSTLFGTPSIIAACQRTRSARFRTVFGQAQAERTTP